MTSKIENLHRRTNLWNLVKFMGAEKGFYWCYANGDFPPKRKEKYISKSNAKCFPWQNLLCTACQRSRFASLSVKTLMERVVHISS